MADMTSSENTMQTPMYLFLCPDAQVQSLQDVWHCVMMFIVETLKCNNPVLWPILWYRNSVIMGLGFLFQIGVFYNTLH